MHGLELAEVIVPTLQRSLRVRLLNLEREGLLLKLHLLARTDPLQHSLNFLLRRELPAIDCVEHVQVVFEGSRKVGRESLVLLEIILLPLQVPGEPALSQLQLLLAEVAHRFGVVVQRLRCGLEDLLALLLSFGCRFGGVLHLLGLAVQRVDLAGDQIHGRTQIAKAILCQVLGRTKGCIGVCPPLIHGRRLPGQPCNPLHNLENPAGQVKCSRGREVQRALHGAESCQ